MHWIKNVPLGMSMSSHRSMFQLNNLLFHDIYMYNSLHPRFSRHSPVKQSTFRINFNWTTGTNKAFYSNLRPNICFYLRYWCKCTYTVPYCIAGISYSRSPSFDSHIYIECVLQLRPILCLAISFCRLGIVICRPTMNETVDMKTTNTLLFIYIEIYD